MSSGIDDGTPSAANSIPRPWAWLELAAQAADGGHEPQLLELRRVQLVREVMHGGGQLLDPARQFLHPPVEQGTGPGRVLGEEVQLHGDEGQALVQVVVQLAGDPPAFRFLGLEQPAGQRPQLALALPQDLLRPPPVRPFQQQADDQQGLGDAKDDGPDDLPPVEVPEARRLVQDDAAGRQPLLGDAPPLQLTPVEHGRVLGRSGEADAFGFFAGQDAVTRCPPRSRPRPRS